MPGSLPWEFQTIWSKIKISGRFCKSWSLPEVLLGSRPVDDETCFLLIIWTESKSPQNPNHHRWSSRWIAMTSCMTNKLSFSKDPLKGSNEGQCWKAARLGSVAGVCQTCLSVSTRSSTLVKLRPSLYTVYRQHMLGTIQICSRFCILARIMIIKKQKPWLVKAKYLHCWHFSRSVQIWLLVERALLPLQSHRILNFIINDNKIVMVNFFFSTNAGRGTVLSGFSHLTLEIALRSRQYLILQMKNWGLWG